MGKSLGINNFFADNGLEDAPSWLCFPADPAQTIAVIGRVFFEKPEGLRFVFSTRSKVPYILSRYFDENYKFVYRSWDAVIKKIGQTSLVLFVESQNQKTGVRAIVFDILLERGLTPKYGYIGAKKEGSGGLWEQILYRGLDPQGQTSPTIVIGGLSLSYYRDTKELAGLI